MIHKLLKVGKVDNNRFAPERRIQADLLAFHQLLVDPSRPAQTKSHPTIPVGGLLVQDMPNLSRQGLITRPWGTSGHRLDFLPPSGLVMRPPPLGAHDLLTPGYPPVARCPLSNGGQYGCVAISMEGLYPTNPLRPSS